jgi:hypothetical protein
MFRCPSVVGSWPVLAGRLDATGVIARWSAVEPALAGLTSLDGLPSWVAPGTDRDRADEVLGALVRLAAVDGGDDPDAVLVLLHLLSDGARALAARLRDLADEVLLLVVGELTVQIRSFPWRRRTRAYAANLLLDTRAALWRELRPGRGQRHTAGEVLVDPLDHRAVARLLDQALPAPGEDAPRLAEVLVWAARTGVARVEDLALLAELAYRDLPAGRGHGGRHSHEAAPDRDTQVQVAGRLQISERTLRRRRDRALAALAAASEDYLRAVA